MKKLISIVVILLFIELAFAPSINANVRKEELIEFTTEVCSLNGNKQTITLTRQQTDEIEVLFDSIREQLNATESRQEAEKIFKDTVVELDKYDLLGGLSVKQAQRLVTGEWIESLLTRFNHFLNNEIFLEPDVINYMCLFSAFTIDALDINIWSLIVFLIGNLYYKFHLNILYLLSIFLMEFSRLKPIRLLNQIDVGVGVAWSYFTFGLYGKRIGSYDFHTADGFSGLKIISNQEPREAYYLGFVLRATKKYSF